MPHALFRILVLVALGLFATSASAQTTLSCDASPFGGAVVLQSDREVMLGIVGRNAAGVADIFQYSDDGQAIPFGSNPGFAGLTEWTSVAVDLNGDGKQETAYAGINGSGNPVIAVVDENSDLIDTWTDSLTASNIQIVAADFYGGQDRKEELFVAWEQGASSVRVIGLIGAEDGGIGPPDGEDSEVFSVDHGDRDAFALTSGDFLLEGREQVAVVTVGEPGGNRTVFFDFLFRDQGQTVDFQVQAAPEDIFSDEVVDIQATAGHLGGAPGPQMAVAIQYETLVNDFPLELWISDFDATRNGLGAITGVTRSTVAQDSGGSSALPQVPRAERFALATGDVLRDGTDELLLAFPSESPSDNLSVWTYKYRPGFAPDDRFPVLSRHSYPLSAAPSNPSAVDLDDVSIDVADIDGDGFADAVTAIAFGEDYDLRRWRFEASIAEGVGTGCGTSEDIGGAACPGTEFLPFPDDLEADGLSAQGVNLADFRQQPAAGTWELCVADSVVGETGVLRSWTLRVNDEAAATSAVGDVAIPDNTQSPDACKTIDFEPASATTLIEDVVVEVAVTHTYVGDLSIVVKSPLGSSLTLMNRPGRSTTGFGASANLLAGNPLVFTDRAPSTAQTFGFLNPSISGDLVRATVALPDVDGDSPVALRSSTAGDCRALTESLIQNVVFLPPVFSAIQDRNRLQAQIGQALDVGERESTQVERRAGNSISGYIGASIGGSVLGVTAKASARRTAGRSYESTTGEAESTSSSQTVSEGDAVDGSIARGGLVIRQRKNHDCFQYPVFVGDTLVGDSFMRFCELTDIVENAPSVEAWNVDAPTPETGPEPAEWAPIVRGWANLALGADTSSSFSATSSSNAVDGLIPSGTPFRIDDPEQDAYIEVDLGEVRDIQSIRLHVPSDRRAQLADLRLYAMEFERSDFDVPSGPDVSEYFLSTGGGVLDVVNISTMTRMPDGSRAPKAARYIRIRSPFRSFVRFALDEIQVFGSDELSPERHPVAVCDPAWGDGWFRARTFARGLINDFVWTDVMGDLDWRSTLPAGSPELDCVPGETNSPQVRELAVLENTSLDGAADKRWEISNSLSTSLEASSAISHSSRYGAEFDVEAGGAVGAIMAGGGREINSGITRAESSEQFWTRSINTGGSIPGIANSDVAPGCDYMPRPFAYRGRFASDTGYTHRPLIVDYLVETRTGSWTHAGGVPLDCLTSNPVQLTVESLGAAGVAVLAEPEIYSGTTTYTLDGLVPSTPIQLLAPSTAGEQVFVQWTGCDSVAGTTGRLCSVQVDSDRTITAEYESSDPVLLAHWPLDGNADDVSGNGFHGQLAGTTGFSQGAVGQSLDLGGREGWVDIPGNILNQLNSCSMSVWINLDSLDPGDPGDACCNAIYNEDDFFDGALHNQFIPVDDPDTIGWVFGGQSGQQGKVPAPGVGEWVHYVKTYSAAEGDYRIYRNGVLEQEGTHLPATPGEPSALCGSGLGATIGAWDRDGAGTMARFFDGQIDDLRLYTQELSAADALALAQQGSFEVAVRSTGINGVGITGSPSFASGSTDYTVAGLEIGAAIELSAPRFSGDFEFVAWTGCSGTSGPSATTCEVTVDSNRTVTASYAPIAFDLSVRSFGATSVPIVGDPVSAGGTTDYTVEGLGDGTTVIVTAPATSGGLGFTGWLGCDLNSGSLLSACQVTMTRDRTVIATYDDVSDDIFRDSFEGNPAPPR